MAKPKKLPSGQWRIQGYHKDNVTGEILRPSFTAPSKDEVRLMAAEWKASYDKSTPQKITVDECIARYIDSKRPTLSPSTLNGYIWMQNNRYQSIGKMPVSHLTNEDLQRYVSDLSRDVSVKSVKNAYGLLISAIGIYTKKTFKVTMPQNKALERHIPTDADIKALMDAATPKMRTIIALAASGTMRLGEIPALKYKDILRAQNAVYVHADIVHGPDGWVYKECPKTSASVRVIPMPESIMEMIGDGDPDDFIFNVMPGTIEKNFWKLRNRVGLKCRFHDLRHYAASIMHALGIPDVYIMERGGWKSDTVLKSIYRNSLSDQSKKFAAVANDHFSKLM